MQKYAALRRLINKEVSQDPFLLHGTSVETIFELGITGRIPPGKTYYLEDENRYLHDSGLYFSPVTSKFENMGYIESIDREGCIDRAKRYARSCGFNHYLAHRLNCQIPETLSTIFNWKLRNNDWNILKVELEKQGIELSTRQMIGLHSHAIRRKGVIVEPNKSILELHHDIPGFDDESMFVTCEDGLDMGYIERIVPLGSIEERLISKFLEGRLEYRGFRTELKQL
jgi:hypothetical protein